MNRCKYICCAGGGNKGLLYIGALEALIYEWKKQFNVEFFQYTKEHIKGFSGTSVGALFSLALLMQIENIREICLPFASSLDRMTSTIDVRNIANRFGLDSGIVLKNMISSLLHHGKLQDNVTFSDMKRLFRKDFVCCATSLNSNKPVYFSAQETPNVKIIDAVYMSMTIPILFIPQLFRGDIMIDGALTDNIPRVFPASETLFFSFENGKTRREIDNFSDFSNSLINACFSANDKSDCDFTKEGIHLPLFLTDYMSCENQMQFINIHSVAQRINCGYASVLRFFHPEIFTVCGKIVKLILLFPVSTASSSNILFDC